MQMLSTNTVFIPTQIPISGDWTLVLSTIITFTDVLQHLGCCKNIAHAPLGFIIRRCGSTCLLFWPSPNHLLVLLIPSVFTLYSLTLKGNVSLVLVKFPQIGMELSSTTQPGFGLSSVLNSLLFLELTIV